MKLIITILFLSGFAKAQSVYHIKNGGNDAFDGLTDETAWEHITKITSGSFVAGDSILLKRGSIFNDSIIINFSGTLANRIVIGAYGTGVKPEITGFKTLAMSNAGSNIWTATASSSVGRQNTVLINDTMRYKARYPNTPSILTWTTLASNKTYMVIPHTANNYTGKEVAVRSAPWETDVTKVLSHNTGLVTDTIYFTVPVVYGGNHGSNAYFFQNDPSYLDVANEYSYDSTSKLISVYSVGEPSVKYSSIDTLIRIHKKSYITIQNITFSGANVGNIWLDSLRGVSIENCVIKNGGAFGIYAFRHSGVSITSDTIENILSNGTWSYRDTSMVFEDNYLNKVAILPGMGGWLTSGVYGAYYGFASFEGVNSFIQRNKVFKTGYIGISWKGLGGTIKYNFVDSFCIVKGDGGGIYTSTAYTTGTVIKKNIISRAARLNDGDLAYIAAGIYLDDGAYGITADSNTIDRIAFNMLIKGEYNTITNNTIFGYYYNRGIYTDAVSNAHRTITDNIIYVPASNFSSCLRIVSSIDTIETINRNYYFQPADTTRVFSVGSTPRSLSAFKALYPQYETNPVPVLTNLASQVPALYYNPTLSDSTVTLPGGWYVDVRNRLYGGSMVIEPFGSRMLFQSTLISAFKTGGYKFR